ncbi:MAG: Gfo/Idh/MocA family oxidoreductase [Pseudomonadota bacterium]
MTVHYGVIGCGMMGQEHLRNIALLDDAKVSAIFEPDSAMMDTALGIAPGARHCTSVEDVLKTEALDCLLVASPNHLHVAQVETIAERRPLPLLVEKPLFTDPDDRARISKLEADYPAPVWVAMEYRYMPPVSSFLDMVDEATGGITMLTIREHRFPFLQKVGNWNRFNRYSGGTLVEKCCHFFDLMRLIMRAEPVRVMASAGQDVNHLDETYDGEQSDIWDGAFVIVDFENGKRAMLELCMYAEGSRYQEEITAVGPAGKIEVKVPGPTRFWQAALGAPPVPKVIVSPRNPVGPREIEVPVDAALLEAGDHNGSTFFQHQKFLNVVRGQGVPEVTLEDGAKAVELGLAAQRSAVLGETVQMK